METVNGSTVIHPSESAEPTYFGPEDTSGAYVGIIGVFQPGEPAPPFHIHPNTDEAFYVADGQATFLLGDRELTVSAGGFVFVPRGTAHTVWNSGDAAVRGLLVISPAMPSMSSFLPKRPIRAKNRPARLHPSE